MKRTCLEVNTYKHEQSCGFTATDIRPLKINFIWIKKLLILIFALNALILNSQVTDKDFQIKKDTLQGWKKGGMLMLNLSQGSFTNWSAGGENLITYNALINLFTKYTNEKFIWDNTLDLSLGMVHQGDLKKKSDDRIDFSSKLGRSISDHLFYAGLLNFKTQFRKGYNYPNDSVEVSGFMAPAYVVVALGLDYRPETYVSFFLAPLSNRTTFVNDQNLADAGAFGVDTSKNIRFEFGGFAKMLFQKDVVRNVNLLSKIELFSNYLDNPQNVTVNWELLISMKVNKYLGATISSQLIYDDAVKYKNGGPRVQFREIIGVGFSYQF